MTKQLFDPPSPVTGEEITRRVYTRLHSRPKKKRHKNLFAETVVSQIRTTKINEKLRNGKWMGDSPERSFKVNCSVHKWLSVNLQKSHQSDETDQEASSGLDDGGNTSEGHAGSGLHSGLGGSRLSLGRLDGGLLGRDVGLSRRHNGGHNGSSGRLDRWNGGGRQGRVAEGDRLLLAQSADSGLGQGDGAGSGNWNSAGSGALSHSGRLDWNCGQ